MPDLHNSTIYPNPAWQNTELDGRFKDIERNGGRYGARIFPLTRPGDKVQLAPELRENYHYMVEHLGRAGVEHAAEEDIIWDTAPEVADDYPDFRLVPYSFGPEIHAVRPNERRLAAVVHFGDKNYFIEDCQQNGDDVLPTHTVNEGKEIDYEAVIYPALYKPPNSSRGEGTEKVTRQAQLEQVIALAGSQRFQVQRFVKGAWLSSIYEVVDGQAMHLANTEQIMKGREHVGNRFPTPHNPRHVTDPVAQRMADAGIEDKFGIDLVAVKSPTKDVPPDYYIVEGNARFTGAMPGIILSKKLGIRQWSSRTLPTTLAGAHELDLGKTAYNPERQIGVIIFNNSRFDMGGLSPNTIEVVVAGTPKQQAAMEVPLLRALREPANRRSISVQELPKAKAA